MRFLAEAWDLTCAKLPLASSICGTSEGIPYSVQAPLFESLYYAQGMFMASWAEPPGVRDFFYYLSLGHPHSH